MRSPSCIARSGLRSGDACEVVARRGGGEFYGSSPSRRGPAQYCSWSDRRSPGCSRTAAVGQPCDHAEGLPPGLAANSQLRPKVGDRDSELAVTRLPSAARIPFVRKDAQATATVSGSLRMGAVVFGEPRATQPLRPPQSEFWQPRPCQPCRLRYVSKILIVV